MRLSNKKGKTYEELYGEEKARQLKNNHSKKMTGKKFGPCPKEKKEKLKKSNKDQDLGKSWEERWGREKAELEKEKRRQRMSNGLGKYIRSFRGPISEEEKEEKRIMMKNGQAAFMNSCIKDDSKPENELFILACKALPRPIHKFPIYRVGKGKRSYNADIADSSLGIILEFDGYFHFCDQEHIDYHNKRQQEIEEDGWRFLRYNIYQKFPSLEQVQEDVQKLLLIETVE